MHSVTCICGLSHRHLHTHAHHTRLAQPCCTTPCATQHTAHAIVAATAASAATGATSLTRTSSSPTHLGLCPWWAVTRATPHVSHSHFGSAFSIVGPPVACGGHGPHRLGPDGHALGCTISRAASACTYALPAAPSGCTHVDGGGHVRHRTCTLSTPPFSPPCAALVHAPFLCTRVCVPMCVCAHEVTVCACWHENCVCGGVCAGQRGAGHKRVAVLHHHGGWR